MQVVGMTEEGAVRGQEEMETDDLLWLPITGPADFILSLQQHIVGISISLFEWTFVLVCINEFACVSVYVSILWVPLMLGRLACSSNQVEV